MSSVLGELVGLGGGGEGPGFNLEATTVVEIDYWRGDAARRGDEVRRDCGGAAALWSCSFRH